MDSEKEPSKFKASVTAFLKDVLVVVAIYLVFTTVLFASFHIPSGSMEPTLEVGDRIMVSKFDFGYNRYSVLFDPDFLPESRLFEDRPSRGEVVVFTLPHKDNKDFIKRVIGLPGDRIQMVDGRLYINGTLVERTLIREVRYTEYRGFAQNVREYEETLPGGTVHRIYERTDLGPYDKTPVFVVPEDHYFMMGDNRDGSADSRDPRSMGFVHAKYLIGRARFTTFSLYNCDQGKPIGCTLGVPYERFFVGID